MSEQANLILGTAGHIDHGKSSLVRALTGTDPDRLAEEKRRGITIELGFAQLTLPSGRTMGVVDVPGHEKFVRHMVAGATGVDVALLVIAADDGIMPQTVEHMAVLELLGVRSAVVALTKIDLVDEEWRAFIADDVAARLEDGPFAGAPIVGVSSRTGEGLDELRAAIDTACAHASRTKDDGAARMPIDRVFTVKGFGTVVTGTLWSGQLAEGDELVVLPSGARTRVRSVQMHGASCERAAAGNRVAVSLAGLSTDEVRPGDFLSAPAAAELTDRFDAEFTYLDPFAFGRPLKSGARIHVAHGTREVQGRVLFMDGAESLDSGAHSFAQVRLDEPLPLAYRDQFIVRSWSPVHVIGGGTVLSPAPRRRTTLKPEERTMLTALDEGNVEAAVGAHLELASLPETLDDVARACGLGHAVVERALDTMEAEASLVVLGAARKRYARGALVQKLVSKIERALLSFHTANPQATGMSKEALRQAALPAADAATFDALLDVATERGAVARTEGEVSHPKAGAGARKLEQETAEKLACALAEAQDAPLEVADIAQTFAVDEALVRRALATLVRDGRAVRLDANRYYDVAVMERYREAVATRIREAGPATAADLKEAMGLSRKYAMPLLEYFDATGLTRREGDLRVLV
ncbi:MAG: selenocysteine-specific translation elongation factor [Eggerthellaceae bacterium]|nr:selenocysteine-specific translation elongation factor [Eggerthellaceae bacterium]